ELRRRTAGLEPPRPLRAATTLVASAPGFAVFTAPLSEQVVPGTEPPAAAPRPLAASTVPGGAVAIQLGVRSARPQRITVSLEGGAGFPAVRLFDARCRTVVRAASPRGIV